MKRSFLPSFGLALAVGTGALLGGCQDVNETPPDSAITYVDDLPRVAAINGFSWDPEVFIALLAQCGPTCPQPPLIVPHNPLLDYSQLEGTQVMVVDPAAGRPVGDPGTSNSLGAWTATNVPAGEDTFYVPSTLPTGSYALPSQPGDPFYQGPAVAYVPTTTIRPIIAKSGTCVLVEAASLSKNGILQAVAQTIGKSVDDLLDASQVGGVAVIALAQPGLPIMRLPAFDTAVVPSVGSAFAIGWAPPGSGIPGQSDRGFYVEAGPTSSMGITAVVLKPEEAGQPVTFTVNDPTHDPASGRPWDYQPMTVPLPPGQVTYGTFVTYPTTGAPPPSNGAPEDPLGPWFCLPE
jgi:hypothetical protein